MTTLAPEATCEVTDSILNAFSCAQRTETPFEHWDVSGMLPDSLTSEILKLRLGQPQNFKYDGTRANDSKAHENSIIPPKRMFVGRDTLEKYPFFKPLVDGLLDPNTLDCVAEKFGLDTTGLYLRVEYINDFDGFFLEPHKDIVEKKLTLLLYLGDGPEYLGTDFYDESLNVVKTARFIHNHGYIFKPGDNTWHGLEPNKFIPDRRCSLLINYVSFPTDWPVQR